MNERQSVPSETDGSPLRRASDPQSIDYVEYQISRPPTSRGARRSTIEQVFDETPADGSGDAWHVRGLGWLGVGLGLAKLLAPGRVGRLASRFGTPNDPRTLRLLGARVLLTGLAIVARRRPSRWLWSRVVGDAIDLGLVFGTGGWRRQRPLALAAMGAIMAVDLVTSYRTARGWNGAPPDQDDQEGWPNHRLRSAPTAAADPTLTGERP